MMYCISCVERNENGMYARDVTAICTTLEKAMEILED